MFLRPSQPGLISPKMDSTIHLVVPVHRLLPELLAALAGGELGRGYIRAALEQEAGEPIPFARSMIYLAEPEEVHFFFTVQQAQDIPYPFYDMERSLQARAERSLHEDAERSMLSAQAQMNTIVAFGGDYSVEAKPALAQSTGAAFALLDAPGKSVSNGTYFLTRTPLDVYILYTTLLTKMFSFYTPEQWVEAKQEYEDAAACTLDIDVERGWYVAL